MQGANSNVCLSFLYHIYVEVLFHFAFVLLPVDETLGSWFAEISLVQGRLPTVIVINLSFRAVFNWVFRKTKTKVIALASYKEHRKSNDPIKTHWSE